MRGRVVRSDAVHSPSDDSSKYREINSDTGCCLRDSNLLLLHRRWSGELFLGLSQQPSDLNPS